MLASRIARWNGFVAGGWYETQKPGWSASAIQGQCQRSESPIALHPGYKINYCASAAATDNRTGSSTYFITADG